MKFENPVVLGIIGLAAALLLWIARRYLSAEAKRERRRRRSNARVSSTARRPMVKFSVRTKKNPRG